MEFQLEESRTIGEVNLTHWDSVHGDDVDILLTKEGAYRVVVSPTGGDQLIRIRIDNLSEFLRQLAIARGI
jgi:hypothetical protein